MIFSHFSLFPVSSDKTSFIAKLSFNSDNNFVGLNSEVLKNLSSEETGSIIAKMRKKHQTRKMYYDLPTVTYINATITDRYFDYQI